MERRESRDDSGSSQGGPNGENVDLMSYLLNIMENQQKQIELLRQGLLVAPKEQRPENVSDFQKIVTGIFRHWEASGCRRVDDRYHKSSEGSPDP